MSQTRKIGRYKTKVFHTLIDNEIALVVRYHDTNVVIVTPSKILLDTGGWFTYTTKLRMNQASNQYRLGYHVYQDRGVWYCAYGTGINRLEFTGVKLVLDKVKLGLDKYSPF